MGLNELSEVRRISRRKGMKCNAGPKIGPAVTKPNESHQCIL